MRKFLLCYLTICLLLGAASADTLYATLTDMQLLPTYGEYLASVADGRDVPGTVEVRGTQHNDAFEFDVPETGFYTASLYYRIPNTEGREVTCAITVDGETPCEEMKRLRFLRAYANASNDFAKDIAGNDIRPSQIETPVWLPYVLSDADGMYSDPLKVFLTAGTHTLALTGANEHLELKDMVLTGAASALADYAQYQAECPDVPAQASVRIEAEHASLKSSPMLYPASDRSSVSLSPSDAKLVLLNSIGGASWSQAGQWLEWTIDVPEDGEYQLTLHMRQDYVRGMPVYRQLTIDGALPFAECAALPFAYQTGWRTETLPYTFYLTAGTHTLRLTNTLGPMDEMIREVQQSVLGLNQMFRKILMITGSEPDGYRDYQLKEKLPDLRDWMLTEYDHLSNVSAKLLELSDQVGDREAILVNMSTQLLELSADVEKVVPRLSDVRANIAALGTWLNSAKENAMALDTLTLSPAGSQVVSSNASFFDSLAYEVQSLAASFVVDYSTIGATDTHSDREITVWVATGRDQANIIKTMADELFTSKSGISVKLMLVDVGSLLPAVFSGQGPDVAMMIGGSLPMNYAMRGAVADLTQFDDFDAVAARFHPEAMVAFTFRDACYALPETLWFPMLFYRKDILNEIGVQVPETWDDVKAAIAVLSKNSMSFGYASLTLVGSAVSTTQGAYALPLYQMGGSFYTEDGASSALSSREAIAAFEEMCDYYVDYGLRREYDFATLFRSGEMPLGVADLSLYSTLQVFAPELEGLWGFVQVPGTVQADGTVDHTVPCAGGAIVLMEQSGDRDAAWEYMKWWTEEETQIRFDRELETLMGAAARYATANRAAFSRLSWDEADLQNILMQYEHVRGVPEVPGGYYSSRCIMNALYDVIVAGVSSPREALTDQVAVIDAEIRYKRKEFRIEPLGEAVQ